MAFQQRTRRFSVGEWREGRMAADPRLAALEGLEADVAEVTLWSPGPGEHKVPGSPGNLARAGAAYGGMVRSMLGEWEGCPPTL